MMNHLPLPTFRFADGTRIAQALPPQKRAVTLTSPALEVMTDLTEVRAAIVQPATSLPNAELKMIHQGVRLLFVVSELPSVEGIVTAGDIQGDKPLRLVQQRQLRHSEISVADVMTPLSSLDAVDFDSLGRASVGQVVATLLKFGRPHLLVVEREGAAGPARIRGLVSQTQIERQLGATLPSMEIASTFSEIRQALA
jgi:CBS domain-containing protein